MGDRRVMKPEHVRFKENGLVPAVVQDQQTGQVLMLAYMNRESLQKTIESGKAWYWSRERQQLWMKGETSGNVQEVLGVAADCDQDALLLRVDQQGSGACHEGDLSCFHYPLDGFAESANGAVAGGEGAVDGGSAGDVDGAGDERAATRAGAAEGDDSAARVLEELFQVVLDRKARPQEGSYTAYLFEQGLDKILKKVGEEASEVIIAAKGAPPQSIAATGGKKPDAGASAAGSEGSGARSGLTSEVADLVYHLFVLLADRGISLETLFGELKARRSSPDAPPKPPKPSNRKATAEASESPKSQRAKTARTKRSTS